MQTSPHSSSVLHAVHELLDGRKPLLCVQHGSHLFGTARPESDRDIKVVFLPTAEEILLGKCDFAIDGNPDSRKMTSGDMDIQAFSLMRFLSMLGRFDPVALECFFAGKDPRHVIYMDERFTRLHENADRLIFRDHTALTAHARANLGRLSPDNIARARELSVLIDLLQEGQGDLPLRKCPKLLNALASQPHCGPALHQRDGTKLLDEQIPTDAIENGGARNATLFLNLRGRLIDASTPIEEIKQDLQRRCKDKSAKRAGAKRHSDVSSKNIYHALRLLSQFAEYHLTGELKFPSSNRWLLNDIRNGVLCEDEIVAEAARAFEAMEAFENQGFRAPLQRGESVATALVIALHGEEVKN